MNESHVRMMPNRNLIIFSLPGGNFKCELIGWSRYALFVGMLKYMYEVDDESTFYVIDSFEGGKRILNHSIMSKSINLSLQY